ncbi:MAG TPA: hypothetical protein PLJ88_11445 [Agitococcus sp.]|nr:hypothetical protein [Agitococcus sp.]
MNKHGVNLFTIQRVFNRLLDISSQEKGVIKIDYSSVATSLILTKSQFIQAIKNLSKSDYIEYIFDGDCLYFKITNIGMEYAK